MPTEFERLAAAAEAVHRGYDVVIGAVTFTLVCTCGGLVLRGYHAQPWVVACLGNHAEGCPVAAVVDRLAAEAAAYIDAD